MYRFGFPQRSQAGILALEYQKDVTGFDLTSSPA
jgi:hypothetical protein